MEQLKSWNDFKDFEEYVEYMNREATLFKRPKEILDNGEYILFLNTYSTILSTKYLNTFLDEELKEHFHKIEKEILKFKELTYSVKLNYWEDKKFPIDHTIVYPPYGINFEEKLWDEKFSIEPKNENEIN